MSAILCIVRAPVAHPDAYDRRRAIVKVDGGEVVRLGAGDRHRIEVAPGEHEVSFRLALNFGTASIGVDVVDGQTVLVTAAKRMPARYAIPPSKYWLVSAEPGHIGHVFHA